MGNSATGFSADQSTMEFIEAWVREHINVARYRPSEDGARAQEMAKWLRKDAAESGMSDAEIDRAIAGSIGAGHGLINYISDAMAAVTNATVQNPQASRLADEDF